MFQNGLHSENSQFITHCWGSFLPHLSKHILKYNSNSVAENARFYFASNVPRIATNTLGSRPISDPAIVFQSPNPTTEMFQNMVSSNPELTLAKSQNTVTSVNEYIKKTFPSDMFFICYHCNTTFSTMERLKSHMFVHKRERPHKCPICVKSFKRRTYLSAHMLVHSDERKYMCDWCLRSFKSRASLVSHGVVHITVRSYGCSYCKRYYRTQPELERHWKVHCKNSSYTCSVCKESFTNQKLLNFHLNENHLTCCQGIGPKCVKSENTFIGCMHIINNN